MWPPIDRRRAGIIGAGLLAAVVAAALTWMSPRERALGAVGPRDRRLTNLAAGISVEAPAGWTLSQHTGYRDTIVLLLHPDGSRISVTAAATPMRTAADLVRQNIPGLSASGLRVVSSLPGPRGSVTVDLGPGSDSSRGQRLRQSYLVRETPGGWQAIVLTLVCREGVFDARTPALDFVLTRMGLDEPTPPASDARGLSASVPSGESGGRSGTANGNRDAAAQQTGKR
jgi:hypothetical protein